MRRTSYSNRVLFLPVNNNGLLNFQEDENERKRAQELERQKVASKMEELETAKSLLEKEMSMHKKRLQMEAQAARQVKAGCDYTSVTMVMRRFKAI